MKDECAWYQNKKSCGVKIRKIYVSWEFGCFLGVFDVMARNACPSNPVI
jgi:hypothetical protein